MTDVEINTESAKTVASSTSAQSSGDFLVTNMKLMTQTQFALQEASRLLLDELIGLRSEVVDMRKDITEIKTTLQNSLMM